MGGLLSRRMRRSAAGRVIFSLLLLAAAAGAYQLIALAACLRFLRQRDPSPTSGPPAISILKPLRGLDENFYHAIRSHAVQEYGGEFELLFGVQSLDDPAVPLVERLRREFPDLVIRLIPVPVSAPNGKVGVLIGLAREARYPVLLVNDSDITVPVDYLARVVAPLNDERVGLVTCLYRASAETWPAQWEALSIATDFAPSTLVAPLFGVREFAFGSTLCFRASDLARIGGFAAVADYLADDYQLGKKLSGLGKQNHLSRVVVDTRVGGRTFRDCWDHQVRWARTIRVCNPGGYLGIPITLAGVWILLLLLAGLWWWALGLLAIRLLTAFVAGVLVLGDRAVLGRLLFVPVRDGLALVTWAMGLRRSRVVWRDRVLTLTADGRIVE